MTETDPTAKALDPGTHLQMKPLEAEKVIQGRYLIKELIGKGGMGQVYLAIDQRLGHKVALKRTTVGDDASLTEAFENEARTLAQLRHPYLPKVSDHFVDADEQFLVMEYISGDDLSQRLKSIQKPFPLNWVLFWSDEILEALNYLHTHVPPIIHRDIKPQNLKLTDDNHIVLLDFGLSKHSVGKTRLTTSGSVVGYTPHYAPLEQIRGTGTNAQSDIYALSSTLYHLLSNQVPPDALTRADALLSGKPDPLRQLTEQNGEVTEIISETILKGMEISQDKRFATARDMQKRLRKAYNELQESMTAETVAFNMQEADLGGTTPSISGEKTEVIPDFSPVVPAEVEPEPPPPAEAPVAEAADEVAESFSGDKTEVIDPSEMEQIAGVGTDQPSAPESDYSGDKTEVIPYEEASPLEADTSEYPQTDIPSDIHSSTGYETSEDVSPPDVGTDFSTSEDFAAPDYATSEDVAPDQAIPDATVPAISLGDAGETGSDAAEASEWDAEPSETDYAGEPAVPYEGAETGMTDVFEADSAAYEEEEAVEEQEVEDYGSVPAPAPARTGSTGKYIAILGGLAAILLLVMGSAFAVGWYYYKGGFFGGSPTPAPTPFESPVGDTTPDMTPLDGTPDITPVEETPETEDTPGVEDSPETGRTPRGGRTPSPRTPRPTPTRAPTRRPDTPKPTPKPTPRTLPTILQ